MIRILKDCIYCCLMKKLKSFWTNHLPSALYLLYMTVSWMIGIMLFLLAMAINHSA